MIFFKEFRQAVRLTLALLLLCGVAYPYALTGLGQLLVSEKAGGSIVYVHDVAIGSALVGQHFTDPRFLKGRPSAVNYNTYTAAQKADGTYEGVASGSDNMGASNPALAQRVKNDMAAFLAAHPGVRAEDVPTDLLTASGSGLDPHISPAAARLQIPALAQHTGLSKDTLKAIIARHTTGKQGGILGGETVHVLKVNVDIAHALGLPPTGAAEREKE